jgi:hypothetical protein
VPLRCELRSFIHGEGEGPSRGTRSGVVIRARARWRHCEGRRACDHGRPRCRPGCSPGGRHRRSPLKEAWGLGTGRG